MGVTIVSKPVGRPRAASLTVRISKSGLIRLSPDLCFSKGFAADKITKEEIILRPSDKIGSMRVYHSNKASKSGLLSAVRVFSAMNINPGKIAGVYTARIVEDSIVIDLRRKGKEAA